MTNAGPHASRPLPSGRHRSILSRITTNIAPRSRHLSDLHIETEDPRHIYGPGALVNGIVHFTVHKVVRFTHIVLYFQGFAKVYRNAFPPGEGIPAEVSTSNPIYGRKGLRAESHGYATIFEKELVLCGSGCLGAGRYQIPFEVQFPPSPLPSSIDFERGTITYLLTAVLTRPTTVAPTLSCERKLYLLETVDIASLNSPKRRAVTLKPLTRRPSKFPSRMERSSSHSTLQHTRPSSAGSGQPGEPRSPSISELSTASAVSEGSGAVVRVLAGNEASEIYGSQLDRRDRTIKASIDLLRDGYLPGDFIPVKVAVTHTKPIKVMQGIIVTLYRRGSIDPLPSATKPIKNEGKGLTKEELFARSRSGLGALFSAANSAHTFRMDLAQSVSPMIVNPNTLQAETKTAVQVPDDVFPSITCVPNGIISFTYHLEVVMDLNGRTAGMDRIITRMSMTRNPSINGLGEVTGQNYGIPAQAGMNHIFDTATVRRMDSIAHCTFEITVGTKDSRRKIPKRATDPWSEAQKSFSDDPNSQHEPTTSGQYSQGVAEMLESESQRSQAAQSTPSIPPPDEAGDNEKTRRRDMEQSLFPSQQAQPDPPSSSSATTRAIQFSPMLQAAENNQDPRPSVPAYRGPDPGSTSRVPPPDDDEDEEVDEKTRLRRMEEMLLPGAPPDEDLAGPANTTSIKPSAPTIADVEACGSTAMNVPAFRSPLHTSTTSAANPEESGSDAVNRIYSSFATDDKQDLEHRRLLASASSPDDYDEDGTRGESEANANTEIGPQSRESSAAASSSAAPPLQRISPSAPLLGDDVDDAGGERFSDNGGQHEQATSRPPSWAASAEIDNLPLYQREEPAPHG